MLEKLLQGIDMADTTLEVENMTRMAAAKWMDDTLSPEQYKQVMQAAASKLDTLTPKSVAETAPLIEQESLDKTKCVRCKTTLTHMQVMMGVTVCVECARRFRNVHGE